MWFDLQITKTLVILIHLIEQIVGLKVFSLQIIRADFFVFLSNVNRTDCFGKK